MKKAGEAPVTPRPQTRTVRAVQKVVRPALRFLGSMGESYYEAYEKLKAKRRNP